MKAAIVRAVALVLVVGAVAPMTASAHRNGLRHNYKHVYYAAKRQFGATSVGRQIVSHGYRTKDGTVRPATKHEIAVSIRQLRRLLHPPPPLLVRTAVAPAQAPAGVASPGVAVGSSHMACIIKNESGGDPGAVNGQYKGIGQWAPSTWVADGGTRYASTPLGATYQQQLQVLAGEGEGGMSQQQGQYDGCG